ncbi:hypothetical protein J6590_033703 [Homalodisca vitripennis]|nr:hypothetical protein J6590_033703 [Homalodisca vitripennis]
MFARADWPLSVIDAYGRQLLRPFPLLPARRGALVTSPSAQSTCNSPLTSYTSHDYLLQCGGSRPGSVIDASHGGQLFPVGINYLHESIIQQTILIPSISP